MRSASSIPAPSGNRRLVQVIHEFEVGPDAHGATPVRPFRNQLEVSPLPGKLRRRDSSPSLFGHRHDEVPLVLLRSRIRWSITNRK